MAKQDTLIGTHPTPPDIFGRWLAGLNRPDSATQCHRSLSEIEAQDEEELLEWLSNEIIRYHYHEDRIGRLKAMYESLGFDEYAEQYRMIPNNEDTRKGNMAEIIMCEYVISSTQKHLIKTYRFRYSTNVDQSMKGDDMLMVDYNEEKDDVEVYLGEAKFRQTPTPKSVRDIANSLSKDTKPLSFPFLVDRLRERPATQGLADKLDKFIIDTVKRNGKLTYTGFLLSNEETAEKVEANLDSDNPRLVFISLGVNDPSDFMQKVFALVQQKLANPSTI